MSKSNIRIDKTCLNCNYVVSDKFCSNCGQENTEPRKTFHHLFVHFFEDFTHYENSFWKTIRYLIFKPGKLSTEYILGKRMSYLSPIKLYIFVSFITFFLISILPVDSNANTKTQPKSEESKIYKDTIFEEQRKIIELENKGILNKTESDSLQKIIIETKINRLENSSFQSILGKYKSVQQLDSIQKYGKPDEKLNGVFYWLTKKSLESVKGKTPQEVQEKFFETFIKNIPKALFIYMPLFALVLWLFQSKKRWYYFDHGIFTLHYFSFLLLATLIIELNDFILSLAGDNSVLNSLSGILKFIMILYTIYYYFPAHKRFYNEKRITTIFKGIIIFFINMIILGIILTGIAAYSFINIH